jgi:hypothetical protein
MLRQALEAQEKVLGYDHVETLYSMHWLVLFLYRGNRHKEAETMFRRAQHGREKILGIDNALTQHTRALADKAHRRSRFPYF